MQYGIQDRIIVSDPIYDLINDAFRHYPNNEDVEEDEKIQHLESGSTSQSQDISTQDSVAQALGIKEHSARVRGLDLGPCPSQVFGRPSFSHDRTSSSSSSYRDLENQVSKLKLELADYKEFMATMEKFVSTLMQNYWAPVPPNFPTSGSGHSSVADLSQQILKMGNSSFRR
ncbi:hypothetical protein L6164_021618 [Bauhinia variegata]|uniref:Uncharacterized protein n=1 Tax=Bauhinia variegata TaxID=167791 RepID=A0ACB9N120_BAUVA|nr:hypothetical protein L6164_021618 [Bauhinia variegata]